MERALAAKQGNMKDIWRCNLTLKEAQEQAAILSVGGKINILRPYACQRYTIRNYNLRPYSWEILIARYRDGRVHIRSKREAE
jgi:hypothetical protein